MTTKKVNKKVEKFDFTQIISFVKACESRGIDPEAAPELSAIPERFRKPLIAFYHLMVGFEAINNGKEPDWANPDEPKWFAWFRVLSSGSGFSDSAAGSDCVFTSAGSRLSTDESNKVYHMIEHFKDDYENMFLFKK